MLGDAVSRSFHAVWPQEIFHDQHADPQLDFKASPDIGKRLSFFNFRHDVLKGRPELSLPSMANQSLLFNEYLEYLASSEKAVRYLLDIKYTSWHHLDSYWRVFYQRPHLLAEATKLRLPLVHLKRSNLFALYCSQKLAAQTGVWQALEDQARSERQLTVDASRCARELDDIRTTQRLFDRWLAGYPVRELEYETLLAAEGFSENVEQTFTGIYGIAPLQPLSTVHRKVTPPLSEVVRNKDEVLSALRGTDFQGMAEQALS
jgi:hypothetical protein